MTITKTFLRSALSSALLLSAATVATTSFAADESKEQCAGVIKAGKNDCATSKNECHGHVSTDRDAEAWIYVPKGTCERISGAHLSAANDPTPGAKN